MGHLIGGTIAIYLLSLLVNYHFKKSRKVDTKSQRALSVLIAVVIGNSIWIYNGISRGEPINGIISGVISYIVAGCIALLLLLLK